LEPPVRRLQADRTEADASVGPRDAAGRRVAGHRTGGTIRRRVARILALPAVVVLVLLGVVAARQYQDLRAARATSESVTLTLGVQSLVHELQTERGITAGVLGGNPSFRNESAPARARTDGQRSALARQLGSGGEGSAAVRTALQQLDGLPTVRAATDSGAAGRAATFDFYTARIDALSAADVGLDRTTDERLRRGATALQALGDATEALAQERAFLNGVFSAGGFAPGEYVRFASMRASEQVALDRFGRFATADQKASLRYALSTGAAQETQYFEQVAVSAADGHHLVVNPQSWWSGLTTVLDDLNQLQQHVGSTIQVRAHDLREVATEQIAALLAAVLLCLLGSVYLAVLASRSITRPLAALAAEAESVAAERLPAAVERVQGGDGDQIPQPPEPVQIPDRATTEIRSVAAALDHLQSAAFGLATEQAVQRRSTIESLANLGRRNQNLIQRQLGFITSLEREEMDPAGLANLFELDHLATRMRRNAASLLVLVGASSLRQWNTGVSVADVIRAAVSEVEEYRRVSLRRVDEALVTGTSVGAVAHLLSELIENGLMFSPPDTEVEVQGRRLPEGYLVAITDQGIGMSTEELARANARLRGEGDFIAAPTRFLGHYVVGTLAAQTGIGVELLPSPVSGVTARVTLPGSLLGSLLPVEGGATVHATVTSDSVASGRAGLRRSVGAERQLPPADPFPRPPAPLEPLPTEPAAPPPAPARRAGPATPFSPIPPAAPVRPGPPEPSMSPSVPAAAAAPVPPMVEVADGNGRDIHPSEPVERTRNGLRKRVPRELRTVAAARSGSAAGRRGSQPDHHQPDQYQPDQYQPDRYRTDQAWPDQHRTIDLDAVADPFPPPPLPPAVDDSPIERGARLSALRDGIRRGQSSAPAAVPGGGPQQAHGQGGEPR
jgi:hypothetical protein